MTAPRVLEQDFRTVALADVQQHPDNPRRGDVGVIEESIEANGFYGALLVQQSTGNILVGNHRYAAAQQAGIESLPALVVDVDDERAKRILLADNKAALFAEWDDAALLAALTELSESDDGLTGSLFTDDELAAMLTADDDGGVGDDDTSQAESSDGPYAVDYIIERAFEHYRERGFPYPSMPLHERLQLVNRLASTPTDPLKHSTVAYHVPDAYHPARFTTPIPGKYTPVEAFERDDKFTHALRLVIEEGRLVNDTTLLSTLGFVRNAQCAAQFRPAFALWYVRRYCPPGGIWLDTSAGWGGRLTAFAASQADRYIGIDPSTSAVDGNRRLADDLLCGDRVKLLCAAAEDVAVEEVGGVSSCDFAFTSPPYFGKERYSDDPAQSYMRYPEPQAWRDGFLAPTMQLQHAALKPGAYAVVNVADVTVDKHADVPLADWTIDCGKHAGLEHVATEQFPIARTPGRGDRGDRFEPCLVFRKPDSTDEKG